ncbi:ABC-2 type transport system ATP-binding protein [Raineyella antarctica]|uniref:ABC-2 type transport system ATP-binding protein n=1 Tax=Raineyella antarctica TaxID=1577474 RepID=A0A1G6GIQ9_9ACTN|nr:ATP-binding cassette domain-containing protein [Raineyella antarctica]SDB81066.1 ABC-2 type transport system ATP-binding protein [Raineyella antarctica]
MATPEAPAIRTTGLTKTFGGRRVVDGIDLDVPTGSVYGFLGPNGSGKTTTIRMLLGLARPTAGEITMLGSAVPAQVTRVLPRVGALVEGPAFHPQLSGRANLARLDAADATSDPRTAPERIATALERVGLQHARDKRFRVYSLGMKQRLGIAAGLLVPRDLLVLDEPTNGLDPQGTREVRHLIDSLAADGITVLVSSHLLSEIEQVCTHLGVMREGRLVAQGPIDQLRSQGRTLLRLRTGEPAEAITVLRRMGADETSHQGDTVLAGGMDQAPEAVVAALVAAGVGVREFTVRAPSLEDVFIGLTGEGFDVSG